MKPFRERLSFDPERGEYRDGAIRYLMIRDDTLMGLLAELPESQRQETLAALARSIVKHGARSAQSYRDRGASDPEALIATIEQTAPQIGWGRWKLVAGPGRLDLVVSNSPFVTGHGHSSHPVCHAVVGMLTAVGGMVLGQQVQAHEVSCAAVTGGSDCQFHAVAV
jgi:predicted hydrocarbon binding protein